MTPLVLAGLLVFGTTAAAQPVVSRVPADDAVFALIAQKYQRDHRERISGDGVVTADKGEYLVEKVVLNSSHGTQIPAYFAYPRSAGQHRVPAVVVQHAANDTLGKSDPEVLTWLVAFAREGWCVLATDFFGYGEQRKPTDLDLWAEPVNRGPVTRQWVNSQRLALDYLRSRPEVDSTRIAIHGTGLGAFVGVVMAGLEDRFAGLVLVETTNFLAGSTDDPELRDHHLLNFAPRVRAPVLVVNSAPNHPDEVRELFETLPGPKELVWIDPQGQQPPEDVYAVTKDWLRQVLK